MLTKGAYVYELYAILNHNGGAFGGHYFAYIKDESNYWHNFNDSTVTPIDDSEIAKTFGGDSANTAYMLMYRKLGTSQEVKLVPERFIKQN